MKIAVYSPYLDTVGGGERYVLTIAEYLSKNHKTDFLLGTHLYNIDISKTIKRVKELHDLDLSKVNFIKSPIGKGSSIFSRLIFLKKYDWLFYLSDGSIFYSSAKNSVIHLQSPIPNRSNLTAKGRIKLSSWKLIMYNSKFTEENAKQLWPKKSVVIYPPISIEKLKSLQKKKQIISVGRFAADTKSKKHEVLIEAFKKLNEKEWSLYLVGGVMEGHEGYLRELKKIAKGFNIIFHNNMAFGDLAKLYGESQIYWHAAGFGETDPTKMEHFGISTVEAMASGCVPVVINLGGQKEIVQNGKSGFLWNSPQEMIEITTKLMADKNLWGKVSKEALNRSKMFSKEKFCQNIERIVIGDS